MDTATDTVRAALYARISQDDRGTEKGVGRQLEDTRQLAGLRGFDVAAEFVENDVSAFAHRPEYERMMAEAATGAFEVIVVYSTSRLWRNRTQRGAAIDALGRLGVRIEAVSGPSLDLASATGRYLADVIAGGDTRESEEKGERVARAARQRAEEGRANGAAAYGWTRVYEHDARGKVIGFHDDADPDAAPIVREVVQRIADGDGLRAVARDLTERGIPTPAGKGTWRHSSVRKLVLRPANIAKRVHHGEVIGDAEWPAIVEPTIWQRAVDRLDSAIPNADRFAGHHGDPQWLLTGLSGAGRCGVCGAELRVARRRSKRKKGPDKIYTLYTCAGPSGCVGRRVEDVDVLVGAILIARLKRPDAAGAFTAPATDPDAAATLAAEVRERLDQAADDYAEGLIDREQLRRITAKLGPKIERAEADARRAKLPIEPVAELDELAQAELAEQVWDRLPLDRRRAVLKALGLRVKIMPTRQGPGFEPEDIRFEWTDGR